MGEGRVESKENEVWETMEFFDITFLSKEQL